MRKPILAALLAINVTAAQAAIISPVTQLVQDCRALPAVPLDAIAQLSSPQAASELESHLLQLFNFNDKIRYFRDGASQQESNQLLMCQVHLADELDTLLANPLSDEIISSLESSPDPAIKALSNRLIALKQANVPAEIKPRLYAAQAAYRHALRHQGMQLEFPDQRCFLDKVNSKQAIDISIAQYLLQQSDESCRASVWQAYQRRAAERNSTALDSIKQLKQTLSKDSLFANYAEFVLNSHYLNSPQLVMQLLDSQTHNIGVTPWNIGRALKQQPKTEFETLTPFGVLSLLTPSLETLGLKFDQPAHYIYRLWHHHRLLGEIHLGFGNKPAEYALVKPVLGRQYGTVLLLMSDKINSLRELNQTVTVLANAITVLSSAQPYYLLNHDNEALAMGQSWLALWLNQELMSALPQPRDPRQELMQKYSDQLRVFRAKLALAAASHEGINATDASDWFKQSFGGEWENAKDATYGFIGLTEQGPEYYLPVWYKAIGKLLLKQTNCCISAQAIFAALVINPDSQPLSNRLEQLLQTKAAPSDIIRRLPNGD